MNKNKLLEVACFNKDSALIACEAGADRIELCAEYREGGITPLPFVISQVRQKIKIPLHVIIRPRGGHFVYSQMEIETMQAAISFCKEQDVDGIVFGVLMLNKKIDISLCKELIDLAGGMSVTFHRAIDMCTDLDTAIKQLIELGVKRVLTSGAESSALAGLEVITRLQNEYGRDLIIMPGGGLRSSNVLDLLKTGCHEFHSAAITNVSETVDQQEIKNIKKLLS